MYVSRAVRTIRDDPIPDQTVELVLEPEDDADPAAIRTAVDDACGTVERTLQLGDLLVAVAHADVDAICAIDGLAAVQTANAIGVNPDEAEEDMDPDG